MKGFFHSPIEYGKSMTRAICVVMTAALVLLCVLPASSLEVFAKTTISAEAQQKINSSSLISEKNQEIAAAETERKEIKSKISDLKKLKSTLNQQKADLEAYIETLDNAIEEMEANILDLQNQITAKEAQIAETEKELVRAQEVEDAQYAAMIYRMRKMYERGDTEALESLMESTSLQDMLNRADYMERVVAYDKKMWTEYKAIKEYVALCEQQLEIEKSLLDEAKLAAEEEQAAMEEMVEEKNKELKEYNAKIAETASAIGEFEEDLSAADAEIKALEAAVEAERQRIIAETGTAPTYDGGKFAFPLASYTRVSDDYGNRINPVTNKQQFHNGVDFASPKGTKIYAAYGGTVAAAGYSATMGNYIMIDHGGGLITIYMHASALYVSTGDTVTRGQHIAAVGSTGRSTGPHLHFSVRENGSYTSPWNYISK